MMNNRKHLGTFLVLLLFLAASLSQAGQIRVSTLEQIEGELTAVPCKDSERLSAVKALLEKVGAAPSEINIDKSDGVENVIVSKPGRSDEKIVIGAHYDKSSDGCGAVDNWSGIVALAHLYSSLKNFSLNKTLVFVGFGKEEIGLLGSKAFVKRISKERIGEYCAMVNIDSLGLGAPQVARNLSTKKLEERAATLAKDLKMPFGNAPIEGADADSSSFLNKKIPALTIHGLTNNWASILHSGNDKPSKVLPESVYLGYRLALALVVDIDKSPCNSFR